MESARRGLWVENLPYIVWFPEHLPYFRTTDVYPPFSGAWSIGIEEKFYLVWPVLGFALIAKWKRARVPVLASIAAASFVTGFVDDLVFLAPYQHLAFGAIAAVLLHRERTYAAVATLGRPPVLLAVASVALALQFTTGTAVYIYGDLYGVHGLVLALLLAGLVTTRSPGVAWLSSRPMAFLAAISYTFYLVHGFLVNGVEMIVPEGGAAPASCWPQPSPWPSRSTSAGSSTGGTRSPCASTASTCPGGSTRHAPSAPMPRHPWSASPPDGGRRAGPAPGPARRRPLTSVSAGQGPFCPVGDTGFEPVTSSV